MRYDDASQAGSVATGPNAHPDVDSLAAGSFGPASGNAITGAGTTSGQAGADQVGSAPAAIVQVQGAGGQAAQSNGAFQAAGQYGLLSMNADGDFTYVRNPGTPDGVQDVFNYTLADAAGATSSTTLTIDIGQIAAAAAAQGVVTLPAGVEMSDIHVNGRDLVINMPDGTQMVIPGGAVFVPQLVIGDVEVPPTNLAALLIDSEPQPAAGPPQSSGGNFANPVPPLDPGVPLGDLIPPTELGYTPPEFHEVNQFEDTKPTVIIETPDNPAGAVDASESVNEKGLPGRNGGEPAGSGEVADGNSSNNSDGSETNTGTIVFTAQDGLDSITIDGADGVTNPVTITAASVGTTIQGQYGVLTITGVNFATGEITYSYTLSDNTSGDNTADHFTVIVTDRDGDTATGTLTVNIIDDVPTARNDTDSLDENNHATGNVMTGAGTTSGAPGADTVGADNAHLTGVSGHDGSDTSFDGSGNLVVHGSFGTLTIDANGSYTYVLDEGSHGGGNDVFTYTLTDGDGDTSQATLTINVPAQNEPPTAADSKVNVSEEGLVPNGIPDGNGTPDTTDSPSASGNINASDPDGDPMTITLQAPSGTFTSGGDTVHWALSPDGHTLTGYTGGDPAANHVVVVTIDNTGHYDVDLIQPFDDPNTSIEDSISLVIPVNVSDGDSNIGVHITVVVEDDSPVVSVSQEPRIPDAVVDESPVPPGGDGIASATIDVSGAFGGVHYGADGPGSAVFSLQLHGGEEGGVSSGMYALDATDTTSGDGDGVGQGDEIMLVQNPDGSISGVANGTTYFNITIDGTTGEVTFTQVNNVWHADTGNNDDTSTLNAPEGSLEVQLTVTDYDGDHDSASVDLSQGVFHIQDDGPSAGNGEGEAPTLTVDESAVPPGGDGVHSATGDFSGLFNAVDFGTDGPGSVAYALAVTPSGEGGSVGSGLYALDASDTTAGDGDGIGQGDEIMLVAQPDGSVSGIANGVTYFTISIDSSGNVTFTDVDNIWHPNTGDNDDSASLVTDGGTLSIVQTVTDADGDTTTASADVSQGVFGIEDDGPTASVPNTENLPTLVVDESPVPPGGDGIVSATADFSGNFGTVHYGTDGAGSVTYALNLSADGAASGLYTLGAGGAQGDPILLHQQPDGSITGEANGTTYFTISVDADGKVTFTDVNNVWHADTGSNDDTSSLSAAEGTISLSQTVTDADGDHASSSIDLSDGIFQIQDDGPSAGNGEGETPTLTVDESPVPPGGDGVHSDSADFSVLFNLPAGFGTDGPGSVDYSLAVTPSSPGGSVGSGLYALDASDTTTGDGDGLGQGDEIMLVAQPDGSVSGIANGVTYFTISIDSSGHVTFTDVNNVWHADTGSNDDSASLTADGGTLSIVQTVTDADGDTATASADVSQGVFNIQDDGPTANVPSTSELPTLVVDESPIPPNGDGIVSATANFAGNFGTVHYGTDGAGSVAYALNLSADGAASGLYTLGAGGAQGDPILLHEQPDGSITGEANGTTYFTISVDSTGTVTFTQSENVYHSNTGSDDDTSFLSAAEGTITLSQTVTDADGDHVSASIDLSDDIFQIQDDGPSAGTGNGTAPTLTLDESPVPPGGDGVHSASAGFSGLFASPVDYGTDGPGSVAYAFAVTPSSPGGSVGSGMFALDTTDTSAGDGDGIGKGAEIMLVAQPDGSVSGIANGTTYFTMSVDSSGNVTFTEVNNIWHSNTGSNDDSAALTAHDGTLNLVQTVTDADGDHTTASADLSSGVFSIQDDGPSVTNGALGAGTVTVDETGPLGGGAPAAIALTDGVHSYTAGNDEDVTGSGRIASGSSTGGAMATATINFGTDGPLGGSNAAGTSYALQIAAGGASGVTTTEGEAIKLIQLDNGNVLGVVQGSGEHAGLVAFAFSINASTGAVQLDQYLSLAHPINPNPNEPIHLGTGDLSVVLTGTDADGDHASTAVDISSHVTFLDDGPTLGAFSEETIPNDVGSVSGTYAFNWGADGLGGLTVTGPTIAGVTYTTTQDGNGGVTLHAWSGTTELFNLDVHPDGTYDFNLVTPDAGSTVSHTLIGIASGQNEFIQTADGTIEFTPLNHNGVDTGTVNSSGAGFGNGNQFTGNGEAVTFEFHNANDAGNTDPNTNPNFVSQVTLDVPSNGFNGSTELITWYATNTVTHETATGTILVDTNTNQLVFDPGFDFNVLTIEGSNADGNGIRMTQITTTTTILPQSADYTFQVSATDGDGDPTGTSNVLIHVDASASTLAATSSLSAMSFDRVSTSSLVSSNDNHSHESRQAGYTAALMGAVAAAGLQGAQHGLPHHGADQGSDRGMDFAAIHTQDVSAVSASGGSSAPRGGHDIAPRSHGDVDRAAENSGHAERAEAKGAELDHGAARVVTELLHGTSGSAHGGGANGDAGHIAAQSVLMPSAEQLAAVSAVAPQASVAGNQAQHNEVVAKVLADALHGGNGDGHNIEALVEAASGSKGSGPNHGIQALASHGMDGVSNGHTDVFAGFSSGHGMHMMDALIVHQDAAPAHG